MNYIITKNPKFFDKIGVYNFCNLEDMILPNKLAIDTETTGLDAKYCDIFCIQIGTGNNNFLIHMYDDNYEFQDVEPYIDGKILVLQNALFDLGFFYKNKFYPKVIKDTMIASRVLYNGDFSNIRSDFKAIMERELEVVYDKTSQKNIHLVKLSVATAIEYSFNDVDRLLELHDAQEEKLIANGQMATYNLHCRFIRALAYMQRCGLPISPEKWKKKMIVDKKNAIKYGLEIEEYIFDNIPSLADNQIDMFRTKKEIFVKINSPKQMLKVFNALKINTTNKDGKDSIKEDVISKTKHEFVDLWLKYQEAQHRVTTFGSKIYEQIDNNRLYTVYNPMVDTARLSSRKGSINFLNFPSDKITRDCFEAKEGHKVVVCDYSAQEGVIMADLSGDKAMTASVVDGIDLHCLLAKAIFPELEGLSDEVITIEHKDKRTFAKPVRFAFSYGGNGYTIYQNLGVALKEGERIYDLFRDLHAGLYEWGDKVYEKAIEDGYISSVDGWRLYLPLFDNFLADKRKVDNMTYDEWKMYKEGKAENNRKWLIKEQNKNRKEGVKPLVFTPVNEKSYRYYLNTKGTISSYFRMKSTYQRLCLNNPVQTRGSHQLKLALCYIFEWIVENGYLDIILICNSVHDEIVIECPDKYAELVKHKVSYYMKLAGDYYLETLEIKAEAAIGQSWYEAK